MRRSSLPKTHGRVCNAGKGGRETLVFAQNTFYQTSTASGAALAYSTYLRYTIVLAMDFFLEKADPRLNEQWMRRFSHSFADLTLYPDSKEILTIGRTIAGDNPSTNERCGVPYLHDVRPPVTRTDQKWQESSHAFFEAFDDSGVLLDFGKSMYAQASKSYRERYPNYPAARIFSMTYQGQ